MHARTVVPHHHRGRTRRPGVRIRAQPRSRRTIILSETRYLAEQYCGDCGTLCQSTSAPPGQPHSRGRPFHV